MQFNKENIPAETTVHLNENRRKIGGVAGSWLRDKSNQSSRKMQLLRKKSEVIGLESVSGSGIIIFLPILEF